MSTSIKYIDRETEGERTVQLNETIVGFKIGDRIQFSPGEQGAIPRRGEYEIFSRNIICALNKPGRFHTTFGIEARYEARRVEQ